MLMTVYKEANMGVTITTIRTEVKLAEKVDEKLRKTKGLTKTALLNGLLERWVKGEIKLEQDAKAA
jgi:hypothetical protein